MNVKFTVLGGAIVLAMGSGSAFANSQCQGSSCIPEYKPPTVVCKLGECVSNFNKAQVEQNGKGNTATVNQFAGYIPALGGVYGSVDSRASVEQNGMYNTWWSRQAGLSNRIGRHYDPAEQNGKGNKGVVQQFGKFNTVDGFQQDGSNNGAKVVQYGKGNAVLEMHQAGYFGGPFGAGNKAEITQKGDHNKVVAFKQFGIGNKATVDQDGIGNKVALKQVGDDNMADIDQTGWGNLAMVDQMGKGNEATVYQHGNYNFADVDSSGVENDVYIKQFCRGNMAVVSQSAGGFNTANIFQSDYTNWANVSQTGWGNTATVLQGGSGTPPPGPWVSGPPSI